MKEDILVMSQRELNRIQVINKVRVKEVKQKDAAEMLAISERQIRRIVRRVKKEGIRGIIHRLRGCSAHNKIDNKKQENILRIYEKKYQGFGAKLFSEKLEEWYRIKISKETLRNWLISEGYQPKKKKKEKTSAMAGTKRILRSNDPDGRKSSSMAGRTRPQSSIDGIYR